jgi:predicted RND superfamily exporter protein
MRFLHYSKAIIGLYIAIAIVFAFLIFSVEPNYDLSQYLPEDSNTSQGLILYDETFGNTAQVSMMVLVDSPSDAVSLKTRLLNYEAISQVVWLDDFIDINNPLNLYDPAIIRPFYYDDYALFTLIFKEDSFDLTVYETLSNIREDFSDETFYLEGDAVNNLYSKEIAEAEIFTVILIILPLALLVLFIASRSSIEPFIILFTLGIAVILNMGSNVFLNQVSYITITLAAALQLAISLDYSLFLMHRYYEFKEDGLDKINAMQQAIKKAFPSITASALTTMIGFLALSVMRYRIGFDIGIVLSKGILFSYLIVFTLLPVTIVSLDKWLEKTKHRAFFPTFKNLFKPLYKARYALGLILIALFSFGAYESQQVNYIYGNPPIKDEENQLLKDATMIENTFGINEQIVYIAPFESLTSEASMIQDLLALDSVLTIDALAIRVDPLTPIELIPDRVKGQYIREGYSRIIITTSFDEESDETFEDAIELKETVSSHQDDYYLLGNTMSTLEIKEVVEEDNTLVMILTIGAILVVLIFSLRSIGIPIILVFIIQGAIFINLAITSLTNTPIIFIGYLVVFALQLGATIDYAVLYSHRFKEQRKTHPPLDSMRIALTKSIQPIIISSAVLAIAGFTQSLFSDLESVREIGLLIGRGALLSLAFIVLFVPSSLIIYDYLLTRISHSISKRKTL